DLHFLDEEFAPIESLLVENSLELGVRLVDRPGILVADDRRRSYAAQLRERASSEERGSVGQDTHLDAVDFPKVQNLLIGHASMPSSRTVDSHAIMLPCVLFCPPSRSADLAEDGTDNCRAEDGILPQAGLVAVGAVPDGADVPRAGASAADAVEAHPQRAQRAAELGDGGIERRQRGIQQHPPFLAVARGVLLDGKRQHQARAADLVVRVVERVEIRERAVNLRRRGGLHGCTSTVASASSRFSIASSNWYSAAKARTQIDAMAFRPVGSTRWSMRRIDHARSRSIHASRMR